MLKGMKRAKGACERRQPKQGSLRGDHSLDPSLIKGVSGQSQMYNGVRG